VPAWLNSDLIAGITAAAVVIPKAMAYATIAGLPVQVGLYTALVPPIIYAIFGTSRILSVTTTTTLAILTGTELAEVLHGADQATMLTAAATLAFLAGVVLLIGFVLRLGFLANFISEPVLVGFKTGVGIAITVDQLPKLLGIHFEKASFFHNVIQTFAHLPESSASAVLLGAATLLLIFSLERYAPRAPAPLIAVTMGIVCSALGLGVQTIGTVEGGLPRLAAPEWSLAESVWPAALGIALMCYTESVASMRAFAKTGDPRPEPDQELLALGLANVVTGLFGGMPAGGGTTQTAVNVKVGAHTQISGVITAAVSIASLLFLAPAIGLIPHTTLAAIVIAYSVDLISFPEFVAIRRIRTTEFWWAVISAVGILMFGTLKGILIAVLASLASLVQQENRPPIYAMFRKRNVRDYQPVTAHQVDEETIPGLLIVRIEGRIYFANSQLVAERVRQLIEAHRPKVLILDCRAIFDIEYSALKMLTQAEETLRINGITLWNVAPNPGVLEVLERAPLGKTLGPERIFRHLETAVEHYKASMLT
jgi:high affinity sulfate transporter 1